MDPIYFKAPAEFRRWFRKHHRTAQELWVGFYKKGSGRASITWPESVDEALCFGWIDGIRKTIDAERYGIRFTPRRSGSIWSAVNTRRAKELIAEGRMQPAGLKAFEARDPEKTVRYSFDGSGGTLDPALEAQFKKNAAAWRFWQSLPPGYRKSATWFVMSARREETRARRLTILIENSAAGRRLDPMKPLKQEST